jgi:uncharacterized protein
MKNVKWFDFDKLKKLVVAGFPSDSSLHGLYHWQRVEKNGLWLAKRNGADVFVVRLFAWLHDSQRQNDKEDSGHGKRAAEFAGTLRGKVFKIQDKAFKQLIYACARHTKQRHSDDITIGGN